MSLPVPHQIITSLKQGKADHRDLQLEISKSHQFEDNPLLSKVLAENTKPIVEILSSQASSKSNCKEQDSILSKRLAFMARPHFLDLFLNDNKKDQVDRSNEFIKTIYQIILDAGEAGVEYRQIIDQLDLTNDERSKFESYMLSHYCRKLVNFGLIEVGSKMIDKSHNIRIAKCSLYSSKNRSLAQKALLKEEDSNQAPNSDSVSVVGSQVGKGGSFTDINHFSENLFFGQLLFSQNFEVNSQGIDSVERGGFSTLEYKYSFC